MIYVAVLQNYNYVAEERVQHWKLHREDRDGFQESRRASQYLNWIDS